MCVVTVLLTCVVVPFQEIIVYALGVTGEVFDSMHPSSHSPLITLDPLFNLLLDQTNIFPAISI